MLRLLLSFVLCCAFCSAIAQNPVVQIQSVPSNYCLGSELAIDVSITGKFAADNKFTVIAYRNENSGEKKWEYPAVLKGNQLITALKDSVLATGASLAITIATSNPKTESYYHYGVVVQTISRIRLTSLKGIATDTLNSTDDVSLVLSVKPKSPGEVTFNSGDKIQLNYYMYGSGDSSVTITSLPADKAAQFSIQQATNACGNMKAEGVVKVQLNAFDFRPIAISASRICIGSVMKINFATDKGSFNAQTKFKVRFQRDNDRPGSFQFIDIPAVLSGKNQLSITIPAAIPSWLLESSAYIGIVASEPGALAFNKRLTVNVFPKPSFKLSLYGDTVTPGSGTYVYAASQGLPPYKFTLNTGETFESGITLTPEKTTLYSIKTFESGCGIIENPAHTPFQVKVSPGLFIPDLQSIKMPAFACEGQTVRLPFKASGITAQTTFKIEAIGQSGSTVSIPAKIVRDSVEFIIPKNASANSGTNYGDIWGIRLVSATPALISDYTPFKIKTMPTLAITPSGNYTVAFPSELRVNLILQGGGPYRATAKNGTVKTYDYQDFYDDLYIRKDTTFKLASLANSCFINADPPAIPLHVIDAKSTTPTLFAKIVPRQYCAGDSLEVEINFNGKFNSGNVFSLSYSVYGQSLEFFIRNVTKSGIYKFSRSLFADRADNIIFILKSSSPGLSSNTEPTDYLARPSVWGLYPQGTRDDPAKLFINHNPAVTLYASKESYVRYSINGKADSAYFGPADSKNFDIRLTANTLAEFKVLSVSNKCGTFNGQVSTFLSGIPYQIDFQSPYPPIVYCVGSEVNFPFEVINGVANATTTFTLEISEYGANDFKDFATVTGGKSIRFVLPKMKSGTYEIRVRSSDLVYSNIRSISIGDTPEVTVGGYAPIDADGDFVVNYGNSVNVVVLNQGGAPWGAMLNNGMKTESDYNTINFYPVITKREVFSISKSWNACGYGAESNTMPVKPKPTITLNTFPQTAPRIVCAGQKVTMDYEINGFELLSGNSLVFSLITANGTQIKLDSVWQASGRIVLTIPSSLNANDFTINAAISSLNASTEINFNRYIAPDVTLFGSNTITAGETAFLFVRANNYFPGNITLGLSNGAQFNHYASYPGGIQQLYFYPDKTTTYKINELKNECGDAKVSGSAVVKVEPRKAKSIHVNTVSGLKPYRLCNADTMLVDFQINGAIVSTADLQVVLMDSSGNNAINLKTIGRTSPVRAVIPANLSASSYYNVRLISKDATVSGGTLYYPMRIGTHASMKITNPIVFYREDERPQPILAFTGSKPFFYALGIDSINLQYSTYNMRDTIWLNPVMPNAAYRIQQFRNECGPGQIDGPSSFRLQMVGPNLPVVLADFTVKKSENAAMLNWRTTSEMRSGFFEIQHSADGKNWQVLGSVGAKGESEGEVEYQYLHASPIVEADNFYRLKMVDTDGTFAFSKIERLFFDDDYSVNIYPNPASESIYLQTPDWASVQEIQLVDMQGKIVYQSDKTPAKRISVKSFTPGIYMIKMIHLNKSETIRKVIIAK